MVKLKPLTMRGFRIGATIILALSWAAPVMSAQYIAACGLPLQKNACGVSAKCSPTALPVVPDYWHGIAPCLRSLRDQWSRQGATSPVQLDASHQETVAAFVRRIVTGELQSDHVKFVEGKGAHSTALSFIQVFDSALNPKKRFEMVQLLNERGLPYNGMGQGDLAYMLYSIAEVAGKDPASKKEPDAAAYRAVAKGAIKTAIAPLEHGGLASIEVCGKQDTKRCAWYHSVTRRDKAPGDGLTLNQDLHVIRDLGLIADLTARAGWDEEIDFERAISEGLNQLFRASEGSRSTALPVLADYLAPPTGSLRVRFLYYGYGKEGPGEKGGYFLNTDAKDCSYHVHVLDLMDQIIERQEKRARPGGAGAAALGCTSPLATAYRASLVRFSGKNPSVWSDTQPGSDKSCYPDSQNTFEAVNAKFYAKQFQTCGAG